MKDAFLSAMSNVASSVCIVTTEGGAGKAGVTVSAMSSVSVVDDEATLLVCVHELSPACEAIRANGIFCVNVLADDQSIVSDTFAGRFEAKGEAKFDCASWRTEETGAPVLDNAVSSFDCKLLHDHKVGTHHIFIGAVQAADAAEGRKPLLYHDRKYCAPEALG